MIFKSATDKKVSWGIDITSAKPLALLEQLEPRILLSGDGLLAIAPDPLDSLFDSMPQVVQYAELLETSEQAEEQAPSDTTIYQPIFTLSADDESIETAESSVGLDGELGQEVSALPNQAEAGYSEENSAVAVETTVDEFENNETKIATEDENLPVVSDENLSTEKTTSIEIRGPPASDLEDDLSSANLEDVALQTPNSILDEYAAELQPDGTVELPCLYLVDPTVDYFDGQIIYLDFDGAQDITYDGPVVVEGIDIPEFSAEAAGLAGQEQGIISQILAQLELTFEGNGVVFTVIQPDAGAEYSTIYIGGNGSEFIEYGFFFGLAEKIDVRNQDLSDNALVFSEDISDNYADLTSFATVLTNLIAHETSHLLGYAHEAAIEADGPLHTVAAVDWNTAAIAMSQGMDQLSTHFQSLFNNDQYLNAPLPVINQVEVNEAGDDAIRVAPTIRTLLWLDVDLNGNREIDSGIEGTLDGLDAGLVVATEDNGQVDFLEFFEEYFINMINDNLSAYSDPVAFTAFLNDSARDQSFASQLPADADVMDGIGTIELNISATNQSDANQFAFHIEFEFIATKELPLDLGPATDELGLSFPDVDPAIAGNQGVEVIASVSFSVDLGVFITGEALTVGDDVFVEVNDLNISAAASINPFIMRFDMGFLGIETFDEDDSAIDENGNGLLDISWIELDTTLTGSFIDATTPTTLGFTEAQFDTIVAGVPVIAQNPLSSGYLAEDAQFILRIGNSDAKTVTVNAVGNSGDTDINAIKNSVQAGLDAAGFGGLVTAGLDGNRLTLTLAGPSNVTELGFASHELSTPDGVYQLKADSEITDFTSFPDTIKFLPSLGQGLPNLITADTSSAGSVDDVVVALNLAFGSLAVIAEKDTDNKIIIRSISSQSVGISRQLYFDSKISLSGLTGTSTTDLVDLNVANAVAKVNLSAKVIPGIAGLDNDDLKITFSGNAFEQERAADAEDSKNRERVDLDVTLSNFEDLETFTRMNASSFIGLLRQVGNWLDQARQSDLFTSIDIPFTSASLGQMLDFSDMMSDALIYDDGDDGVDSVDNNNAEGTNDINKLLRFDDGILSPAFSNVQELKSILSDPQLGFSILPTVSYSDFEDVLTFEITLEHDLLGIEVGTDFNLELSPLLGMTSDTKIVIDGSAGMTLAFGIDLSQDSGNSLDNNTLLDSLGVEIKTAPAVTGENAATRNYGRLSRDAVFELNIDDVKYEITITAESTKTNHTVADLVDDINTALINARLISTDAIVDLTGIVGAASFIDPETDGNRLGLTADISVDSLSLTASTSDPTVMELGFGQSQTAWRDGTTPASLESGSDLRQTLGRLSADAVFTVTMNGGSPVDVLIRARATQVGQDDTAGSKTIIDLVNIVSRAIVDANLGDEIEVGSQGNYIVLTSKDGTTGFTVTAIGTAITELGFAPSQTSNSYDMVIHTSDGNGPYYIDLDGATTVGDVINMITNQTGGSGSVFDGTLVSGDVTVEINEDGIALFLTDNTFQTDSDGNPISGQTIFRIEPINSSPVAMQMGILRMDVTGDDNNDGQLDSLDCDGVIHGSPITGDDLADRFFIDVNNTSLWGTFRVLPGQLVSGLVIDTVETMVTSEEFDFTADHIGMFLEIKDTVGFTPDAGYEIIDVDEVNNIATLSSPVGSLGSVGGTGVLLTGIEAAAMFGFVGVALEGDGILRGEVSADFQAPAEYAGRLTLNELIGFVDDLGTVIQTPILSKPAGESTYGMFTFDVALDPVFPAIVLGNTPQIEVVLHEIGNPFDVTEFVSVFETEKVFTVSGDYVAQFTKGHTIDIEFDDSTVITAQVSGSEYDGSVTRVTLASEVLTESLSLVRASLPPSIGVQKVDLGDLLSFEDLTMDNIISALNEVATFLDDLEALDFLNDPLPLIDYSVTDLLSFSDRFAIAVEDFENNPAGTIQLLETKLREVLGLPTEPNPSDPFSIGLSLDPAGLLKIAMNLGVDFVESFDISIPDFIDMADIGLDGGLIDLVGSVGLEASGSLNIDLDFGIDLTDPNQLYVYDTTGLFATITANATDLTFAAALGPLGLSITGGAATLEGTFDVNLTAVSGGQALIGDIFVEDDVDTILTGMVDVMLPTYFPNESNYVGDIQVGGDLTDPDSIYFVKDDVVSAIGDFDFDNLSLFESVLLAIDGIDLFLEGLQEVLDGEVFGIELPIIGDALSGGAQFIEDFRSDFIEPLREAVETVADMALDFADAQKNILSGYLYDFLEPLGILKTNPDVPDTDPGYKGLYSDSIGLTTNLDDYLFGSEPIDMMDVFMQWNLALGQTYTVGTDIGFDLGIPGLGISTEGDITVTLDWDLDLGFGISFADGFYVDVSDPNELSAYVNVNFEDAQLSGTLAILQLTAGVNPGTNFGAAFAVDIMNSADEDDGRLGFTEIGEIGLDAKIAAQALADLSLTLDVSGDLIGDNVASGMPRILSDFVFDYNLGGYDSDNPENSEFVSIFDISGDVLKEGLRLVEFQDITLDLGSFVSDVIGPVVSQIQEITDPIQPIIDILTYPIPVISDLGPDLTLLDIAGYLGGVDPRLLHAIADVITLINSIPNPDDAGTLLLNFGDMTIYKAVLDEFGDIISEESFTEFDLSDPKSDPEAMLGTVMDNADKLVSMAEQVFGDNWFTSTLDTMVGSAADTLKSMQSKGAGGSKFAFPIFEDPAQVFGLLMGKPAVLITYDMPPLTFEFEYSQFFPFFGALGISINSYFYANIDFAFGYDTLGIQEFIEGDFNNPLLLLDGFYVSDTDLATGDFGTDVPELVFRGNLYAAAELNAFIARAGVGGGIFAEVKFDLYDPDRDGRVRIKELLGSVENQWNYGGDLRFMAPMAIFDISGDVTARLFAFLKINLFLFKISYEWDITPPLTLVDFEIPFVRPPNLATELDNGDLQLNMGTSAEQRLNGNTSDIGEYFVVEKVDYNTVRIMAPGLWNHWQEYDVTGTIIAEAGEGNDIINLWGVGDMGVKFEIECGAGSDQIYLTNPLIVAQYALGSATIKGDEGDEIIYGGGGNDIIYGNVGNDEIHGGGGNDIVFADEGRIADESIRVYVNPMSDGNDKLYGDAGDDILFGAGGDDRIEGGPNNDVIIGDGGEILFVNIAVPEGEPIPKTVLNVSQVRRTEYGQSGGNDVLLGNGGNDIIYGGKGNDNIDGGAGDDEIYGEAGFDTIYGGSGGDEIYGGTEDDTIYGMRPSSPPAGVVFDSSDIGTDTDDIIYGQEGKDLIHGNAGIDTIYGGPGSDELHGDDDDDFIYGQGEPDLIYGGAGNDTIDGGAGFDYIYGGSSNPGELFGDDVIYGGIGSDFFDGQGGSDTYIMSLQGADNSSLSNIFDTGTDPADTDFLIINGTDFADQFLLRASADLNGLAFVALLNRDGNVERLDYEGVEVLVVNGLAGDDRFAVDDVRAKATINGGIGEDFFQIGQLYKSERTPEAANVDPQDVFATIETTRGFLSNGISQPMDIAGGAGDDEFIVFHNKAVLTLYGGNGDDTFTIRAFALADSQDNLRDRTDITGGSGADLIQYAVNAPVNIDGGDGLDTVIVIGTEFADDFVITKDGVYGAGINANFVNIEVLRVDGAEGDDRFFVLSTDDKFMTEIFGGLGSDTFNIAGDTPPIISNDLLGHSGIVTHKVETFGSDYYDIKSGGISANVADNDEPAIVITQPDGSTVVGENGLLDWYTIVLTRQPLTDVFVKAIAPIQTPEEEAFEWQALMLYSPSGTNEPDGSAATLQFTPTNWYLPQIVFVEAPDDGYAEGVRFGAITHTVSSREVIVTGDVEDASGNTLTADGTPFAGLDLTGAIIRITAGSQSALGETMLIKSNTDDELILYSEWDLDSLPVSGDEFQIAIDDNFRGAVGANLTDTFQDFRIKFPIAVGGLVGATVEVTNGLGQWESHVISANTVNTITVETAWTIALDSDTTYEIFRDGVPVEVNDVPLAGKITSIVTKTFNTDVADVAFPVTDLEDGPNGLRAATIEITGGTGVGQIRVVESSTEHSITVTTPWRIQLDTTSQYVIKRYDGLAIPSVTVRAEDSDQPGVIVTETENSTRVIEGAVEPTFGASDTYEVVLTTEPGYNVVVTVTPDSQAMIAKLGDDPGLVPITLTFTTDNWDVPQTIVVNAFDDGVREGFHYSHIFHTVSSDHVDENVSETETFDLTAEPKTSVMLNHIPLTDQLIEVWIDGELRNTDRYELSSSTIIFFDPDGRPEFVTGVVEVSYSHTVKGYDGIAVDRVGVEIGDDNRPGIWVIQSNGSTNVIEGASGPLVIGTGTIDAGERMINEGQDWFRDDDLLYPAGILVGLTIKITEGAGAGQTGTILDNYPVNGDGTRFVVDSAWGDMPDSTSKYVILLDTEITAGSDTYMVVLTKQPDIDTTIAVTPQPTRTTRAQLVTLTEQVEVDQETLTFTTDNWDVPQTITITAINDWIADGGDTKVFAPRPHTVIGIQGPLFVDGKGGEGSLAGLTEPVLLPPDLFDPEDIGETNIKKPTGDIIDAAEFTLTVATADIEDYSNLIGWTVEITEGPDTAVGKFRLILDTEEQDDNTILQLNNQWGFVPDDLAALTKYAITSESHNFFVNEDEQVDILTVFHDDSLADNKDHLTGYLTDSTKVEYENRIHGLGMGPDLLIGSEVQPGGITYGRMEVAVINLGLGDDKFVVDSTHKRDDFQTWTMLNTGGGHDDVTVILNPDDDGLFALNTQDGDDKVQAIGSTLPLIIFGWDGNDTISGGSGDDIIFGDRGRVDYLDEDGGVVTRLGHSPETITGNVSSSTETTLTDGTGQFLVIDDGLEGLVVWINDGPGAGQSRVIVSNTDTQLTIDPDTSWTVLPTSESKYRITGIPSDQTDGVFRDPHRILSVDAEIGGNDIIFGNGSQDIIIGGAAVDTVDGGQDSDLIFGDSVRLDDVHDSGAAVNPRFRTLSGATIYHDDGSVKVNSQVQGYAAPGEAPIWADWNITLIEAGAGNDYIAGGADDDTIFGQGGNDTIQGDGSIDSALDEDNPNPVMAYRNTDGSLVITTSVELTSDGDDYIEGNSGNDVIFGNLGEDDIIGGSSDLFSLISPDMREDGSDIIFGGAGSDIDRNHPGDDSVNGHADDADMILGDNGNIFRLVDGAGQYLEFSYDKSWQDENRGEIRIIPRAAHLLDYTLGGMDYDTAAINDKGAADEIHGESGDDFIYGMVGNDILFGDGQDDDLIGGWGHDWISGGTGDDGILGDDGRIYTSRNGTAESYYDIGDLAGQLNLVIYTPGKIQQATINIEGQLKKTVNLAPFNVDPDVTQNPLFVAQHADDIIYGGLGNDSIHSGSGDDAVSGAEAIATFYEAPSNLGNELQYNSDTHKFEFYDADNPRTKINDFILNFEAFAESQNQAETYIDDGDDIIFGDLGNDWLVGGTGQDRLYGGYGDDLLNTDDNLDTNNDGLNNAPDYGPFAGADTAYGGAGRDVLIGNSEDDRLIDWTGEFNTFVVPFAAFGKYAISRRPMPAIIQYLYDLSKNDGADQTLGVEADPDRTRNGEPYGELGLVKQKDSNWHAQIGSPRDPQAGNNPGGKK